MDSAARASRRVAMRSALSAGSKVEHAAGVGGADDVGDAVFDRDAGHGDGGFEVGGAVVEAEKQVVVDIDHVAGVRVSLR